LGKRLLAAIEQRAVALGYRKLFVETYGHPDFDKARRFYRTNGFAEAGTVAAYLPDDSPMIVLSKRLATSRT
jgi:GNAT superfamily N-acetyltransferase